MHPKTLCWAIVFTIVAQNVFAAGDSRVLSEEPKEIYGVAKRNIQIREGNGAAGPTGLIRALAKDYLFQSKKKYAIAWYQDITSNSLKQLKNGNIDIALVYEKIKGLEAQKEGFATHYAPIFNDHFLVVGPKKNPAKLDKYDSIQEIFLKIFKLGEHSSGPVFLSRGDNSSANVKEQFVWQSVGFKPWKTNAPWYFTYPAFPQDTLLYANENSLYTIVDWGTWISNQSKISNLKIFSQGGKTLLNPCFALLNKNPSQETLDFWNYLRSDRAQTLISEFGKNKYNGLPLFTPAQQLDFNFVEG